MLRLFLLVVLSGSVIHGFSQGINFSHKYNTNSALKLQHRVVYNQNSTDVLLQVQSPDSLTVYEGILDFRSSYTQNQPDSSANIYLENAVYSAKEEAWLLDLSFPNLKRKRLLIIQFVHKQTGMVYNFDVPLFYRSTINQSSTILFDTTMQVPVIAPYFNTNTLYKTDQIEVVTYYSNRYSTAVPPMSVATAKGSKDLSMDSMFVIQPNRSFSFAKEGMYFFENDTTNLHGSAFCVRNKPFPKYTSILDLVEPLRYVCTNTEFNKLKADPSKANFEKVWLDITNDAERAKQVIKGYYKQIEQANILFTTYKEGWKTDMGMIYIVFGVPTEVYKTDNKEEWIYVGSSQQSKLKFTFAKVDNVFSSNHYLLQRKKEYKTPWMNRVDLWRKARISN